MKGEFKTIKDVTEIPAGRDIIRVSFVEMKGRVASAPVVRLDIRRFYQDVVTEEFLPSPKGISLSFEQTLLLVKALVPELFTEWRTLNPESAEEQPA